MNAALSCYDLQGESNGLVVIINNVNFDSEQLCERQGSDKDEQSIIELFSGLNFKINFHRDLTVKSMMEVIDKVKSCEEYKSLILFILSHGDAKIIYGKDTEFEMKKYTADDKTEFEVPVPDNFMEERYVVDHLADHPNWNGKPKLLFVQACQGGKKDPGCDVVDQANDCSMPKIFDLVNNRKKKKRAKKPTLADFFCSRSSEVPFVSFRNEVAGSPFIQSFVNVVQQYSAHLDLLHMMTLVNERVQAYVATDGNGSKWKQTPYFKSYLGKLFFFQQRAARTFRTVSGTTALLSSDHRGQQHSEVSSSENSGANSNMIVEERSFIQWLSLCPARLP